LTPRAAVYLLGNKLTIKRKRSTSAVINPGSSQNSVNRAVRVACQYFAKGLQAGLPMLQLRNASRHRNS
jgi:hypothetical protein